MTYTAAQMHCMLRGDWRRRPLHQHQLHTLFLLQMVSAESQAGQLPDLRKVLAPLRFVPVFVHSFFISFNPLYMLQGAKLKTKLYTGGEEEADLPEDNEDARGFGSAKLEALVALLKQTPQSDKCLVFSSFVKCISTLMWLYD